MGRVWENMVRTVKRALYSMMKNTMLADFQLMTIFTEIENIINNCPLTDVSDDFDDLEALTPNHFLLGKYNNMEISANDENIDSRKLWKQAQDLTKQFWRLWLQG